jgi:hypothetical protein
MLFAPLRRDCSCWLLLLAAVGCAETAVARIGHQGNGLLLAAKRRAATLEAGTSATVKYAERF